MKILYTTGDALWTAEKGNVTELPSYRAMQYRETIRQIHDQKSWKTSGSGAVFMGTAEELQRDCEAEICGAAPYRDGLLYTLRLDDSGGLYQRSFSAKAEPEGHICSGNEMRLGAIDVHGEDVAACVLYPDGSSHIGVFHLPQSYCNEITEGDVVESAPSWSQDGNALYFSVCGIARWNGKILYSPAAVARYDVQSGRMENVAEHEKYDYLVPREDKDGCLWYIRQPYHSQEEGNGNILLDTLLFPVRIVKAIGGFLNVFSMRYGGESLRSGGNARSRQKSERDLFFEGNLLHAEKNLKENQKSGEEYPGVFPRSRVLIRRSPAGEETVMARGVLDYCLCEEGFAVSNGSHILYYPPEGKPEELAKVRLARQLCSV